MPVQRVNKTPAYFENNDSQTAENSPSQIEERSPSPGQDIDNRLKTLQIQQPRQ